MSYKKFKIWQLAREVSIEIHKMTLTKLPKHEKHEIGAQIRRSSKSVKANIVEGYGRRRYPKEYIRFLVFAFSSNLETLDHLETLYETGSLADELYFKKLKDRVDYLGRMLNKFISAIQNRTPNNEKLKKRSLRLSLRP